MHLRAAALFGFAWLVAIASLGCGRDDETGQATTTASEARPPNVLLVTIDTLRHDHLGYVGHTRPTSPRIDALARESVVFTRAYSQSGWTLPSMASVMTGHAPAVHGAQHFHERMDPALPTLASLLRARGFTTRGFVSHILLRPKYGFDAGFERLDTSVLALGRPKDIESSATITHLASEAVKTAPEPFFVWAHYFDPHNDYLRHAGFEGFGDDDMGRYDQEVAWTDAHVGRLLDALDDAGRQSRTLVVLTADHGEEFGEHGGVYHYTLHEEVVRVPLLVRAPGVAHRIDDTLVQQIDLLPTILGAVDVPAPEALPGRDLLAGEVADAPVFIERERPSGFRQRAMVDGTRKLVVIEARPPDPNAPPSPPTPTDVDHIVPGVFFYDLARDPGEQTPIDPASDPAAASMLEAMARHFESLPAGVAEAVELSPETEEALRALGYLK